MGLTNFFTFIYKTTSKESMIFHGGYSEIKIPKIISGKYAKDFGTSGKIHDYDIVSGPMANDQVYNYISDYINGVLTKEQFWVLAKFKHPTHQICFCTEAALKSLTFKSSKNYVR